MLVPLGPEWRKLHIWQITKDGLYVPFLEAKKKGYIKGKRKATEVGVTEEEIDIEKPGTFETAEGVEVVAKVLDIDVGKVLLYHGGLVHAGAKGEDKKGNSAYYARTYEIGNDEDGDVAMAQPF